MPRVFQRGVKIQNYKTAGAPAAKSGRVGHPGLFATLYACPARSRRTFFLS
jgi:hypothetical protein